MTTEFVRIGPMPVNAYPLSAWTRIPKGVDIENVWQLCGPTVEKHIHKLPLWQVFCVVYFEGLAHGAAIAQSTWSKEE